MANKPIPTLQPGGVPPAPDVNESRYALREAEQGMNRVSQGLSDIGKTFENIAEKKKQVDDAKSLGNLSVNAENDFIAWKAQFDLSNPDPNTYAEQVGKQWDKIGASYKKQAPNRNISDAYELRMLQRKNEVLRTAYHEQNVRWKDVNIADRLKQVEQFKKLGVETTSEDEANSHRNSMIAVIRGASGNLLHPTDALRTELEQAEDFDKKRQRNLVARTEKDTFDDPLGVIMQLETPYGGKYGEIKDELTRQGLLESARRVYKVKQAENDHEIKKIQLEQHNNEENEIYDLYLKGKLKSADLNNYKNITGDEKYIWSQRLEARAKKGIADVKTNFGSYINIMESIGTEDRKATLDKIIKAPDISEGDKEKLYDRVNGYSNSIDDHWKKKSYDLLKTQIAPTRGLGVVESPAEQELYIQAVNALDRKIAESKRSKQPIAGEDIYREAEKLLPLYIKSQKEIMQMEKERLRSYTVGTIYKDSNGKRAIYKGKDSTGRHIWENVK